MNKKLFLLLFLFSALYFIPLLVSAELELPPGLQKIKEYNQQYALEFLQTISFPIAFLAGLLSFIAPCVIPILPAFFAVGFKEKKHITKMTFVFFLGFGIVFSLMGIAASILGQSFVLLQEDWSLLVFFSGLALIILGLMSFFGKGFSSFIKSRKPRKTGSDAPGIFMMGVFFSIGWTACLGPILAGVLLMASIFSNFLYAGALLFVYSLGIFTPLLVVSLFYDKYNLSQSRFIRGRTFLVKLSGKKIPLHSTNIISGLLLVIVGMIFVIFRGTGILNDLNPFSTLFIFNELQGSLLGFGDFFDYVFWVIVILLAIIYFIKKNLVKKKRKHL